MHRRQELMVMGGNASVPQLDNSLSDLFFGFEGAFKRFK
jgi:hypothetical protein